MFERGGDMMTVAAEGAMISVMQHDDVALRLVRAGTKWENAVQDAANEAAALAWTTTVPALVFPVLFEEKVVAAMNKDKLQTSIWRKSQELLTA